MCQRSLVESSRFFRLQLPEEFAGEVAARITRRDGDARGMAGKQWAGRNQPEILQRRKHRKTVKNIWSISRSTASILHQVGSSALPFVSSFCDHLDKYRKTSLDFCRAKTVEDLKGLKGAVAKSLVAWLFGFVTLLKYPTLKYPTGYLQIWDNCLLATSPQ